MRFYVVSVGDTMSPAFLTLSQKQEQTANCEVRNQEGRGKEGSGVTHPGAVSQFPRGCRGDKTPPDSTIHVAIRHSPKKSAAQCPVSPVPFGGCAVGVGPGSPPRSVFSRIFPAKTMIVQPSRTGCASFGDLNTIAQWYRPLTVPRNV
jgi:hypothetical protein